MSTIHIDEPQLPHNGSNSVGVNIFSLCQREPIWSRAINLPPRDYDFMHGFVDEFVENLDLSNCV